MSDTKQLAADLRGKAALGTITAPIMRDAANALDAQAQEIATLRAELAGIDAVMARRPALDKPTRRENIEHAISVAGRADKAERQVATLRADLSRVQGENETLRALLAQREASPSQWQPIETAPKDGTRILVWSSTRDRVISYWDHYYAIGGAGYQAGRTAWVVDDDGALWDAEQPTHWMSLPTPPESR